MEKMKKTTIIFCMLISLTGCKTTSTTKTIQLSVSGKAEWIVKTSPKAKLYVSVYAKLNGENIKIADDIINLEFPFETLKYAIDAPDWKQDGEVVGWWYIRPDNIYEPSKLMIKTTIEKPEYFIGTTKEIIIDIN